LSIVFGVAHHGYREQKPLETGLKSENGGAKSRKNSRNGSWRSMHVLSAHCRAAVASRDSSLTPAKVLKRASCALTRSPGGKSPPIAPAHHPQAPSRRALLTFPPSSVFACMGRYRTKTTTLKNAPSVQCRSSAGRSTRSGDLNRAAPFRPGTPRTAAKAG
jgi:hypothetical protein